MDVRLPNGTVIKNVPEGTSKDQIMAKAIKSGMARYADFYPDQAVTDVLANRQQALSEFYTPIEKIGIGARNMTARAASRINKALGLEGTVFGPEAEEVERQVTEMSPGGGWQTVGEILPILAATGRVPGGMLPSSAAGAASGYLTAQDPRMGALMGGGFGALGSLLGAAGGRGINALRGRWAERTISGADDTANAIRQFQEMGGRVTPGQASGGKVAQMFDNAMTSNPATASGYRSIAQQNQGLLTRIISRAIGANTDELGPTALRTADDFLSKQFDEVADQLNAVPVTKDLADDVVRLLRKGDVRPHADALGKGALSGRAYMDLRSKLLRITRGSSDKVDEAWDVIDDLDQVVEGIAPSGYKQMYAAARERYKTLLAVDKYRRGISGGQANALTFDAALQKVFGKQYTRDMGTILPETKQMFTAARAMADPRMAAHLGGSPTAERLMPWLILGGATLDPAVAGLAGAGWLGSRAALAAPSPLAAQVGGAAGRVSPTILDPEKYLNAQ